VRAAVKKTVTVVAEYDRVARSPSTAIRLPSVVALRAYHLSPRRAAFTRFNVFLRDRFVCQYCGEPHKPNELTFDHVLPRSKGGPTAWTNIVAACRACNMAKNDAVRQPRQSPREPTARELFAAQRLFPPKYLHETWLDYLYWDAELER
jgi:5-methylcytosine-specific restriction endonuclease McrA